MNKLQKFKKVIHFGEKSYMIFYEIIRHIMKENKANCLNRYFLLQASAQAVRALFQSSGTGTGTYTISVSFKK